MLLTNLPGSGMFHLDMFIPAQEAVDALEAAFADKILSVADYQQLLGHGIEVDSFFTGLVDVEFTQTAYDSLMASLTSVNYGDVLHHGGLLDLLYLGVKLGIYPCLIFIGIGAMTDFSPLISNPKSLLIGAGAQFGVFVAFADCYRYASDKSSGKRNVSS